MTGQLADASGRVQDGQGCVRMAIVSQGVPGGVAKRVFESEGDVPERVIVIAIIYSLALPSHLSSPPLHLALVLECCPLTLQSLSPSPIDILSPHRPPVSLHSHWTAPWTGCPPRPTMMHRPLRHHNRLPQSFQRRGS